MFDDDDGVMNTLLPRYMTKIYVASSWRNDRYPEVVKRLKKEDFKVYDFRHPAPGNFGFSWKQADPSYEGGKIALEGYLKGLDTFEADKGFNLDMKALRDCNTCVLVLPAGRSASFEFGYAMASGKRCAVLWPESGDEPDLMFRQAHITDSLDNLVKWILE